MNEQLKYLPTNRQNKKHNGILSSHKNELFLHHEPRNYCSKWKEMKVLTNKRWGKEWSVSFQKSRKCNQERAELIFHLHMLNPPCLSPLGWPPCCPLLEQRESVQRYSSWNDLLKLFLWSVNIIRSQFRTKSSWARISAWYMFSIFKSLLVRYTCVQYYT